MTVRRLTDDQGIEFSFDRNDMQSIEKIIGGQVTINDIKEVNVSDVLGRDLVKPDKHLLSKNIKDKIVLVSGAGGSIGSELCRQIITLNPKVLICVDLTPDSSSTLPIKCVIP